MSTTYKQFKLRHQDSEMTTWLPVRHGSTTIAEGVKLTLKDTDDRIWTVIGVSGPEQDDSYFQRKRSERSERVSTLR